MNGSAEAVDGGLHAEHEVRIEEIVERGVQEGAGGSGIGESAVHQDFGGGGRDAKLRRETIGGCEIDMRDQPTGRHIKKKHWPGSRPADKLKHVPRSVLGKVAAEGLVVIVHVFGTGDERQDFVFHAEEFLVPVGLHLVDVEARVVIEG